jgi:predicted RNA polymerase sigma factor
MSAETRRWARRPTRCRQPSPHATCAPAPPKRRTGTIVLLCDALLQISPSPIVALNRAVAVGMVQGPAAGLEAVDAAAALAGDSALAGYHLFPSVRGDLLMKMGRFTEARAEIQRAISMTKNLRERELLEKRLKQLEKAAVSA